MPRLAWRVLLGIAAVKLVLHAVSAVFVGYGYSADELYFLDCANHLAWGYVDHPPLSIGALAAVTSAFGDSLLVLRLTAALAGAVAIVLAGMMVREMGGGCVAQALAALAMLMSPVILFATSYYSMNAIDLVVWALASYLMLRMLNGGDQRLWLATGLVVGLGLLNKWSVAWLAGGIAVGLLLTPQRHWLRAPWPWLGALAALLIWAPNLLWQAQHEWPTLEFMRAGMGEVMAKKTPLGFVREQFRAMHPLLALLSAGGLIHYFGSAAGQPYRLLGWIWVAVFVLLMASGTARPYYLGPAYPIAFAAGAVFLERISAGAPRLIPAVAACLIVLGCAVSAPLVMPLLSPERYIAYEQALGLSRVRTEFEEGKLPPQFGFQFGWRELTDAVVETYAALPPDDKARAAILAQTFGEAAALNFFKPRSLPRVLGTHNNYWLWGWDGRSGDVTIVVSDSEERLRQRFGDVVLSRRIECEYCMPVLRAKAVYVCRAPHRPLSEIWPELKDYS